MANDDIFFENDVIMDVELENVYIIDQGTITKVVAHKYSSESTYDIGDYVIYRDELYKCIADISTPEEFDSTKWTKLLVVDEIKNIYSILPTKADADSVYTKTETDNLLNEKADADSVYTKTEVDEALNLKADKADTYTKTEVDEALNLKADKADTYTKTEVDNALAVKADASSVYTKTDTDTLLNTKADKSTTYTKTEVDTALANKANSADVYTKTETYSKTEVDTDIYKKTETYSKTEVDNKIANLPAPMIMKGTLGTGGTITDLPTASSENEGFTYKVITDGTYAGQAAKTGDMFTSAKPVGSSDYIWLYIPSGDETFTDTWRGIKVNGTEKLGSSINTGSVDFKNGTNSTAVFDPSDSSIQFNVDGYTQAQVDAKLADKANASDVYAKTETYSQAEVDSKLLAKANSSDVYTKRETYTKTEVNTALSAKADTSTVNTALALKADKADTYTKTEVDDKFDEIDPIGTASGAIATFETNYAGKLKSLSTTIVAKGGGGTPSTPNPIVGHSELNLANVDNITAQLWNADRSFDGTVAFNQLFTALSSGTYDSILTTFDSATGTLHSSGTTSSSYYFFVTGTEHKIPITSGHKYFVHIDDTRTVRYAIYDGGTNRNIVDKIGATIINSTYSGWLSLVSMSNTVGASVDITCKPIVIDLTQMFGAAIADYIYNLEQATAGAGVAFFKYFYPEDYYPYNAGETQTLVPMPYTVSFGQTVYGGVYDANAGKVRITHKYQRGGFSRISKDSSNKLWLCGDFPDSKTYDSSEAPNAVSNMFIGKSLQNCRADDSGFTIYPKGLYIAGYVGNETALDALLPNLEIVYELATPIEIDVSELAVDTIVGTNNVFSDCGGDVKVEYLKNAELAEFVETIHNSLSPIILAGTLNAGETSITFSSDAITEDSLIEIYTDPNIFYTGTTTSDGEVEITFPKRQYNISVKVRII